MSWLVLLAVSPHTEPIYVADLDVRFLRSEIENMTDVKVFKGREGGEGNYGTYFRDWQAGRFTETLESTPMEAA